MLNVKQRQYLKGVAHDLEPVVRIGEKGLIASVIKEIEVNLTSHELIKIRVFVDDREERTAMIYAICQKTSSELVQHIGKLLVIYRQSEQKKITIPNK